MSESKEKLQKLFEEGYVCTREPMTNYDPCGTKYALPIHNLKTGDKQMHCFNDDDSNELACTLMKKQKANPLGYVPTVKFIISGIPNNNLNFEFQPKALIEEIENFGFEVRSKSDRVYDIKLGDFEKTDLALEKINFLKEYLLKSAIKNSVGLTVIGESLGPYYAHSPYSIGIVTDITTLVKVGDSKIDISDQTLIDISSFYSQSDLRSKLIVGWSLLESYFANEHTELLSSDDRKILTKSLKVSGLDEIKIKRLKEVLDGKFLTEKPPVVVIHDQLISLGIDCLDLPSLKMIKGVRGRMAHTTEGEEKVRQSVKLLEPVLRKLYIADKI